MRFRFLLPLVLLVVGACSSGTSTPVASTPVSPPPASPTPVATTAAASAPAATNAADTEKTPPASKPAPNAPPPPGPGVKMTGKQFSEDDSSEMTGALCEELSKTLASLVLADQKAQISPKLDAGKRKTAEDTAMETAKSTSGAFRDDCLKNLAGNPVKRGVVQCWTKAKDLTAFQGCHP